MTALVKEIKVMNDGQSRRAWLDWARCLAIVLVLGTHYGIHWKYSGIFLPFAAFLKRVGWSGVDLFFVLSGFLVGGLLISEKMKYGRIDHKRFYVRRIFKIWPLLFLFPVIYALQMAIMGKQSGLAALASTLPVYFHLQNYIQTPPGHLWSLAVEEHFYLLLPLLLSCFFVNRKDGLGRLLTGLLVVMCLVAVTRIIFAYFHLASNVGLLSYSHFRIDSLLIGVCLYVLFQTRQEQIVAVNWKVLTLAVLAFLVWPFFFHRFEGWLVAGPGLTSLAFGFAVFLVALAKIDASAPEFASSYVGRAMSWVGRFSYPIYLFHPLVWIGMGPFGYFGDDPPRALTGIMSVDWLLGLIIYLALSILIGAVLGTLVEKPMLKIRDARFASRSAALDALR